jgi:hypothetical protein
MFMDDTAGERPDPKVALGAGEHGDVAVDLPAFQGSRFVGEQTVGGAQQHPATAQGKHVIDLPQIVLLRAKLFKMRAIEDEQPFAVRRDQEPIGSGRHASRRGRAQVEEVLENSEVSERGRRADRLAAGAGRRMDLDPPKRDAVGLLLLLPGLACEGAGMADGYGGEYRAESGNKEQPLPQGNHLRMPDACMLSSL